jgi:energy-coupling factor transporter ATP-binding protein EcfA2
MGIRIEASNFRCYESLDITIPDSGLILLDGVNMDEGGSSNSSGKSSICDSLFWTRYGWLPRWKGPKGGSADAVVRRDQAKCWVRVTEGDLTYERRRPNKLKIWKAGVEQFGWSQSDLIRELGQSPERFLVGSYLAQRRARQSFWGMGEQERMKLISIAAGQENSAKAFVAAKARRDVAQLSLAKHEGAQSALEAQKTMLPDLSQVMSEIDGLEAEHKPILASLTEVENTLSLCRDRVKSEKNSQKHYHEDAYIHRALFIHQEYGDADGKLVALCGVLTDRIAEVSARSASVYKEIQGQLVSDPILIDLENKLRTFELENKKIEGHNTDVVRIANMNDRVQDEIFRHLDAAEKALVGACPTCCRDLPEEERQAASLRHIQLAGFAEKKLLSVPAIKQLIHTDELKGKIRIAQQEQAKRQAELQAAPKAILMEKAAIEAELRETQSARRQVKERCERDIRDADRQKADAIATAVREQDLQLAKVESVRNEMYQKELGIKQSIDAARERLRSAETQSKRLNHSLVETKREVEAARSLLDEALDLMEVFGPSGWPSIEFEGFVQRISDTACDLVSRISRGVYSTRLEQASEDSQGNQKTILRPIVLKGGVEVPLDDPSGAKEAIFELAYDIAISSISGRNTPLLIDEALEGLDIAAKEGAMDVLLDVAQNRAVLVIDHASEYKSAFKNIIKVKLEGGISTVDMSGVLG